MSKWILISTSTYYLHSKIPKNLTVDWNTVIVKDFQKNERIIPI